MIKANVLIGSSNDLKSKIHVKKEMDITCLHLNKRSQRSIKLKYYCFNFETCFITTVGIKIISPDENEKKILETLRMYVPELTVVLSF